MKKFMREKLHNFPAIFFSSETNRCSFVDYLMKNKIAIKSMTAAYISREQFKSDTNLERKFILAHRYKEELVFSPHQNFKKD